mmetsp:Transcript_39300/g.40024  ORF Transcript_39300/g.40024 Transcript_39300/m.40024 type:complete len:352 (-) Transcript_39300:303-1358(-)
MAALLLFFIVATATLGASVPGRASSLKMASAAVQIGTRKHAFPIDHEAEIIASLTPKASLVTTLGPVLAASFCAAAIMYPLDLIRALKMANAGSKATTLQLLSNFKNTHGWSGFFTQGLVPELGRATFMRFIKFGLFPIIHLGITNGIPESKGNSQTKAMSALLTSIPEVFAIMPLEIAKVALQLDAQKIYNNNMFKAMAEIVKSKGVGVFGTGYVGVQYRQAAWGTAYFVSLPFFDRQVKRGLEKIGLSEKEREREGVKMGAQLTSGFLAGVFGAMLNTPGDTIRTVIQKRVIGDLSGSTTFLKVGQEIVSSRGMSSLYAGFGFKAIHLGGGGALMAFFVPFFKKLFESV